MIQSQLIQASTLYVCKPLIFSIGIISGIGRDESRWEATLTDIQEHTKRVHG